MIRTILTACSLFLLIEATVAQSPQRNPFQPPVDLNEQDAERIGAQLDGEPEVAPLDLRATLLAGERSSANLGGAIVSIGDEIAGYRLVSVEEGGAVLSKDGETIRLSVNDQDE
ncbi:MAG: hypothetical protein ACR2QQ_06465 [Gammaproteobacteria bacterium]